MSAPTWKLGDARVLSKSDLQTKDSKWIGMQMLNWVDEEGKQRKWEVANRKTTGTGGIDAVAIFPLITCPGKPLSTVLCLQYRPPVERICVELPAGLIDASESPEETAVRELREETGFENCKVQSVSPEMVSDPGMTSANMSLVTVRVEAETLTPPKAHPDAGEHIVVKVVPINELLPQLQQYSADPHYTVDAKLWHLAAGMDFAKSLALF